MPSYRINEPHPTVHTNNFVHSGRGGSGNIFRAPKTSSGATACGPASLFTNGLPVSSNKFSAGRGGAGNIHPTAHKAAFDFDEELRLQATRDSMKSAHTKWHIGRGGAGNLASERPSSSSSRKNSSSSVASNDSVRSAGFFKRMSINIGRP